VTRPATERASEEAEMPEANEQESTLDDEAVVAAVEVVGPERRQDAPTFMSDVNITPSDGGPYLVSGPVHLTDVDGREIPHPNQMALCRCGHSSNKPFCDSTHAIIDFDGMLKN
jgi:CDGSH-type Zn-finger protein